MAARTATRTEFADVVMDGGARGLGRDLLETLWATLARADETRRRSDVDVTPLYFGECRIGGRQRTTSARH
jgi:hypothetical protein